MSPDPVTVALDAGGADAGPAEVARAGAIAAAEHGVGVLLFGPLSELTPATGVELHDAPLSIAKHPDPARAVRAHPDASVVQAVRAVAEGRADALVAGGSTGAALAAGLFQIKRGAGVQRPALAIRVPAPEHPFLMLDVGANAEVRPEHLVQFAHMGAAYAERVLGVARPRVALLSNGVEASRGSEDVVAAHALLLTAGGTLDFVGNVEGFAVATGAADVIVCDGFTGNVALKVMEGASAALMGAIRGAATAARGRGRGACSCARRCARCATRWTPSRRAGRCSSGCASPWWCRTGPSRPRHRRCGGRRGARSPRGPRDPNARRTRIGRGPASAPDVVRGHR
jgi:glycerol-3-phosphate acyltransferase PlsX